MKNMTKYCLVLLIVLNSVACAPPEVVRKERYLWPPPPDKPRIEWLGAFQSQLDLKMTQGRYIREIFTGEEIPFALKRPTEVRSDAQNDKLYVADLEEGGVYIFDFKNSGLRMLSTSKSGVMGRIIPGGLALDGENNLYVLEPRKRIIMVFDASEKYLRTIDLKEIGRRPVAIAIDKIRKRIYVSDVLSDKIVALDLGGTKLFEFGQSGFEEGSFNKPVAIAIASNGNIVVCDSFNARIQVFKESGVFLLAFGSRGDGVGSFQLIKSVAVDQDDNIYVVDGRSHSINIFSKKGELLQLIGSFYSIFKSGKIAPGGFAAPTAIDIDSQGRIFVSDQMNARVQYFRYFPDEAPRTP